MTTMRVMKVIQVVLYLTAVSHLAYCRAIQRDLSTSAKVSKRSLDCSSNAVLKDISDFNDIFKNLTNGDNIDNIRNETVREQLKSKVASLYYIRI